MLLVASDVGDFKVPGDELPSDFFRLLPIPPRGFQVPGGELELLSAKPRVKRGEEIPVHRFSSLADPNEYTRPSRVEGEDDLLHM